MKLCSENEVLLEKLEFHTNFLKLFENFLNFPHSPLIPPQFAQNPQKCNFFPPKFQYDHGYAFGYRVRDYHTGTDFGHTQKRMTDGTTHGEYKILMPDGRTQNVKYKADNDGYHADVSYDV